MWKDALFQASQGKETSLGKKALCSGWCFYALQHPSFRGSFALEQQYKLFTEVVVARTWEASNRGTNNG
jgi:hypothetical protein